VAGQPGRVFFGWSRAIWGLLVPCLLWAGQVVVELDSPGQRFAPAVDISRTANPLVSSQSSARRFLIAVPPLSRVTSVALAVDGETSAVGLPCCSTAVPDGEVSRTASFYRERDSGGVAFLECWIGASESTPGVRGAGSYRPASLEVSYETLPRAERAPRERLLSGCAITDSSTRVFSNPTDVRAWYSAADTSLSPFFGGDPVPYDFEVAELAELPLRCQVIIVAHIGGLGYVPIQYAYDIQPTIKGIREELSAIGVSSILVPFYRTRGGSLARLRTVSEMFGLHHSNAARLAGEIDRVLSRHPQQRVIMVGLSNGAVFADGVTQWLSDSARSRVCTVEVGPPLLGPSDDKSVLRLSNQDQDPLVMGEYWTIMRTWVPGLFRLVYARLTRRELTQYDAYHFQNHDYSWPSVRQEVVSFLEAWLSR
jgi:hypothetical protein